MSKESTKYIQPKIVQFKFLRRVKGEIVTEHKTLLQIGIIPNKSIVGFYVNKSDEQIVKKYKKTVFKYYMLGADDVFKKRMKEFISENNLSFRRFNLINIEFDDTNN